jgi:hypothetical protein
MRNPQALWALVTALLALGVLAGAAVAARLLEDEVGLLETVPSVPLALVLALASLAFGRRARFLHQRSLGRAGSPALVATARGLGAIALIVAVTAALALAVFAVLTLALD